MALLSLPLTTVKATPLRVSQFVVAESAIHDEFGVVLQGNSVDAAYFGYEHSPGEIVQVLLATDNIIHPPDVNGVPHPNNPLLKEVRIGWGVSPGIAHSGRFATGVVRPDHGAMIFVRVFNADKMEEATFYSDSQLYSVNNTQLETFYANIPATTIPLDPGDDDGDGINNSWERSYNLDGDGDGVSNGAEIAAGTDINDANSNLSFDVIRPLNGSMLLLQWPAVAGTTYVVEAMAPGNGGGASTVAVLRARTDRGTAIVPLALFDRLACFRLSVLVE